jgi:hypothetical protein
VSPATEVVLSKKTDLAASSFSRAAFARSRARGISEEQGMIGRVLERSPVAASLHHRRHGQDERGAGNGMGGVSSDVEQQRHVDRRANE